MGASLAYVKRMRLRQREGHKYALDTATASLGLMNQRPAVGPVHETAPHEASNFNLSRGNSRNFLRSWSQFYRHALSLRQANALTPTRRP